MVCFLVVAAKVKAFLEVCKVMVASSNNNKKEGGGGEERKKKWNFKFLHSCLSLLTNIFSQI